MTYEEALETINVDQVKKMLEMVKTKEKYHFLIPLFEKQIEFYQIASEAISLQIAKPVERLSTYMDQITGLCPVCGRKDADQRGFTSYCECGQKLLWE